MQTLTSLLIALATTLSAVPAASASSFASAPDALPASDAERGKVIYLTGRSPRGGDIRARVVAELEMPAAFYPCAQCHRADGRGALEGGVRVPDIRRAHLTSPHGVPSYLGGVRPSYGDAEVGRAIREGLDSAGDSLDGLMPRYILGDADLADLLAYLRTLGEDAAPGVSPTTVRVGALLPLTGPLGDSGRAIAKLLEAFFDTLAEAGPINGRRIELVVADTGPSAATARSAARRLTTGEGSVFCFVGNAGRGADPSVLNLLSQGEVPVVGPLTFEPASRQRGSVFYILPDLEDQGAAALREIVRRSRGVPAAVALIRGAGPGPARLAEGVLTEARRGHVDVVIEDCCEDGADATIRKLKNRRVGELVVAASAEELALVMARAADLDWTPRLTVPAVLAGMPHPGWPAPVDIILPPLARASGHPVSERFDLLLAHGATAGDPRASLGQHAMQMAAFAAAELLTEALVRSGRELRREDMLGALRNMRAFDTGMMPPLSFGPNRRTGTRGALRLSMAGDGRVTVDYLDEPRSGTRLGDAEGDQR